MHSPGDIRAHRVVLVHVAGHWWRRRLRQPSMYRRIGASRDDVPMVVTAAELADMAEREMA